MNWTDSRTSISSGQLVNGRGCSEYSQDAKNGGCKDTSGFAPDTYPNMGHTANTACCKCKYNMAEEEFYGCSSWNGTHCIKEVVVALSLNANGLSGSLPAELEDLSFLEHLHLSENALIGGLPTGILKLTNLQLLNLTANALSGRFASDVMTLPALSQLSLARNKFSGELLVNPSKFSVLERLDAANNDLDGDISSTLTQLGSLPLLREVDLSYNAFHGAMPTLTCGITKLALGGNQRLTAPIPSTLCHNLSFDLDLRDSPVHCPMYSLLRWLSNVTDGEKWRNKWDWHNGTTSICDPSSWHGIVCSQDKTSVVKINLTSNGLSGKFPPSFGEHVPALSSLQVLDLSHNKISGMIPIGFAELPLLEEVHLSHNKFSGKVPPQLGERLKILNLDHNCLSGTLPEELGRLSSLQELRLSSNGLDGCNVTPPHGLHGKIPIQWENLASVQHMDVSRNFLTGEIPSGLGELGRLTHLHLHDNNFTRSIPKELGQLPVLKNLTLKGNMLDMNMLAPLSICVLSGVVDLASEVNFCPIDRNILKHLYDATRGDSWGNNSYWLDPYDHPCRSGREWFGLSCNEESQIIGINLTGNGLYGTLPSELFSLHSLNELKLGDNRLYGPLPTSIGNSESLKTLLLSGNEFSGAVPESIARLTKLSNLHIHANKFTKGLPGGFVGTRTGNVIADCGEPYFYGNGELSRQSCTICCNSEGRCTEQLTKVDDLPLGEETSIFMGCLIGFFLFFAAAIYAVREVVHFPAIKHGAAEYSGIESVYSFLLSNSAASWLLALLTAFAQLAIITVFLMAADIENESSDWEYSMRCPPNEFDCQDDRAVNWQGWLIFGFVLFAFLGRDVISGAMLMYAAGLRGSVRCLLSGIVIVTITWFTIWTSLQYNLAIAMTDTALITNAVIILFVNDLDERVFGLFHWMFPEWVERISKNSKEHSVRIQSSSTDEDLSQQAEHDLNSDNDESIDETPLSEDEGQNHSKGAEEGANSNTGLHTTKLKEMNANHIDGIKGLRQELIKQQALIDEMKSTIEELKSMVSKLSLQDS